MWASPGDVPRAADRVQEPSLAARLELAAQVGDEDPDRVRRRERVIPPDLLGGALARDGGALVADEVLEQLELALGQLDRPPGARALVRVRVERQVGDD